MPADVWDELGSAFELLLEDPLSGMESLLNWLSDGVSREVLLTEEFQAVLDAVDATVAGLLHGVTGGLSSFIRSALWGELATRNHEGMWFNIGLAVGSLIAIVGGFANPCNMSVGVANAWRAWQGVQSLGMGLHAVESFRNGDYVWGALNALGSFATFASIFRACFAAGTPILTVDGSKLIEDIVAGDIVLSRDEFDPDGPVVPKVVEEKFVRVSPVLNVQVRGRVIRTTAEHPFWVKHRSEWVPAKELVVGDVMVTRDGREVPVEAIEDSGEVVTVYNFRMADYHNYFVGCEAWGFEVWAHNIACTPDQVTAATREVLSTATFRRNPGLRARVVEALRQNEFGQAQTLLQEVRGIGPRRAEAIVQRLRQRAAAAPAAPTDPQTVAHIFDGELRTHPRTGRVKAVGYHHEGDAANQAAQAAQGTTVAGRGPLDAHGVYETTGPVIRSVPKASGRSTMFPENWTQADVLRSVNEGWAARLPQQNTQGFGFQGRDTNGVMIQFWLRRDNSGIIDSAHPLHGV